MTANELTKEAIQTLNKNGCFVWRNNNLAVRGRTFIGLKGVPDVVGFTNQGIAVYCETKAIGDKLSTYQIAFLNLAKASKFDGSGITQEKVASIVRAAYSRREE